MSNIFENESEVVDNIMKSAKELGADLGTRGTKEERSTHEATPNIKAKSNCKLCWGKGWMRYSFPGNKGDEQETLFYCKCVKFL